MKYRQRDDRLSSRKKRPAPSPIRRSRAATPNAEVLPAAFNDISARIWDLPQVKAYTVKAVEEILARRNVPKHRIGTPSLEITIPAIEAMRYSPLRHEIAGLIASTMDHDNAEDAHPSFLNVLTQLTEDEVRILAAFPSTGRVIPMADLWVRMPDDHSELIHRNILPAAIARLCKSKARLPLYIDNLKRLELLHEPSNAKIKDARLYANLMRQGFCVDLLEPPQIRRNSSLEKRAIALTSAGEVFRRVCLS